MKVVAIEQVHKRCGGLIRAISRNGTLAFACKECEASWSLNLPGIHKPSQWIDCNRSAYHKDNLEIIKNKS